MRNAARMLAWMLVAGVLGVTLIAPKPVLADEKPAGRAGRTVRGVIVARTATTVEVRPEDETVVRRFVVIPAGMRPDAKYQAFVDSLIVGSEVEVTQTGRTTKIILLGAPGKSGKLVGTVTDIVNGRIEIEDSQGNKKQYVPPFVPGGNKEMAQAIAQRHIGDRVEIRFYTDDWTRVSSIRVLSLAPETTAQPDFEGGTVVGKVVKRDKTSITLKSDDGTEATFLPQRIIGEKDALDKDVLKAIAAAKLGERLEGKWFKDGERWLYSLKRADAKPPTTRPATRGA